jgi:hypothetical protein
MEGARQKSEKELETDEIRQELGELLALGLERLFRKKSTRKLAAFAESSLDIPRQESGHRNHS